MSEPDPETTRSDARTAEALAMGRVACVIAREAVGLFPGLDEQFVAVNLTLSGPFCEALRDYARSVARPDGKDDFRKGYEKGWKDSQKSAELLAPDDAPAVRDVPEPEPGGTVELKLMDVIEAFFLSVPRGGTFTYTAPPECPDEEADPC